MANRLEQAKPAEDTAKPAEQKAAAPAKGGAGAWVPLIANLVLMPVIAWALTTFVLIPKIQGGGAAHEEEAPAAGAHGEESSGGTDAHGKKSGTKGKVTVPLGDKVLVNVSGTAGTRYLVAKISLVGKKADLKTHVEENDPQLRDAAMSILSIKTISDLEKPGMRNIIRSELISAFNDILGKESITDIYMTEFAIQ